MNSYLNNKNLLDLAVKWKYHLGIIAIIAAVIAIVFSAPTFLKPKYRSFAIVYPVNLGEYSEESYTEQMLEILNSGEYGTSLSRPLNLTSTTGSPRSTSFTKRLCTQSTPIMFLSVKPKMKRSGSRCWIPIRGMPVPWSIR